MFLLLQGLLLIEVVWWISVKDCQAMFISLQEAFLQIAVLFLFTWHIWYSSD